MVWQPAIRPISRGNFRNEQHSRAGCNVRRQRAKPAPNRRKYVPSWLLRLIVDSLRTEEVAFCVVSPDPPRPPVNPLWHPRHERQVLHKTKSDSCISYAVLQACVLKAAAGCFEKAAATLKCKSGQLSKDTRAVKTYNKENTHKKIATLVYNRGHALARDSPDPL